MSTKTTRATQSFDFVLSPDLYLHTFLATPQGADFDIKAFHKRALDLGGVGLDTLRRALLG